MDGLWQKKAESQDICFIPMGIMPPSLKERARLTETPGNFVDMDGTILGKHKGLIRLYHSGRERGLALRLASLPFVYRLDTEKNEVVLSDNAALFRTTLCADNLAYMAYDKFEDGQRFWRKSAMRISCMVYCADGRGG